LAFAPPSDRAGSIAPRSNNRGRRAERMPTDGDTDYCETPPWDRIVPCVDLSTLRMGRNRQIDPKNAIHRAPERAGRRYGARSLRGVSPHFDRDWAFNMIVWCNPVR
jgi:hypothetical protein